MNIQPINIYSNNYTQKKRLATELTFGHGGKPLALDKIVKQRSYLIPERVLARAKEALATSKGNLPSLMEIHKETYAPLLACKTLDEAKALFPEFSEVKEDVVFERKSRYAEEFKKRTDKNFALKMLQEFWANLKTEGEIAEELGMLSRTSLGWPLKQIGFVSYKPNYKTLLKASDKEGNSAIAAKTTAYNQLHPDLMKARNKKAAQACKKPEYRDAQRQRMHDYDIDHPERAEKISYHSKAMWNACPEVKEAMSKFIEKEPIETRRIFAKKIKGYPLRTTERRIVKGVYTRFWDENPDCKEALAKACRKVSEERKTKKP